MKNNRLVRFLYKFVEPYIKFRIVFLFKRLLKRRPEKSELLHWMLSMRGRLRFKELKQTLTSLFEYEQRLNKAGQRLVTLLSFDMCGNNWDMDVGKALIKNKTYEPHVTEVIKSILREGDVFLDIGANICYFTLLAAKQVGVKGKVMAFEPNVQNTQLIYANILKNSLKNIFLYPFAAGNEKELFQMRTFGSNGFLEKIKDEKGALQLVQSIRLDELLESEPRLNVIKIDIEGFEPFALKGMEKLVLKHRPLIVTEFSPWHLKMRTGKDPITYLHQLEELNYSLAQISPNGEITKPKMAKQLFEEWQSLENNKAHFDLIAVPL